MLSFNMQYTVCVYQGVMILNGGCSNFSNLCRIITVTEFTLISGCYINNFHATFPVVAVSSPSAESSGPASGRQEEAGEDGGGSGQSRVVRMRFTHQIKRPNFRLNVKSVVYNSVHVSDCDATWHVCRSSSSFNRTKKLL